MNVCVCPGRRGGAVMSGGDGEASEGWKGGVCVGVWVCGLCDFVHFLLGVT